MTEGKTAAGPPGYDHNKRAPEDVQRLFNTIAPGYDRLNRIVSLGLDVGWRRRVARATRSVEADQILDVCTGTGDLAIELARMKHGQAHVNGVDFSRAAVALGQQKVKALGLSEYVDLIEGDAMHLPFEDEVFDVVTIGFGFRNIQDRKKALRDFLRVTKPGGMFVCLEVSQPPAVLKSGYYLYMLYIVPLIARLLGADPQAYQYLGRSIRAFPGAREFAEFIESSGWKNVTYRKLGLGSVAIHKAYKPL